MQNKLPLLKHFFVVCVLICNFTYGQVLSVRQEASISILSGSSISLAGLKIAPSNTYEIAGGNDVYRSSTPITYGEKTSMPRVYNTSNFFAGFTGTLTFSYTEEDLDDLAESDLVLELQSDDDSWVSYTGIVDGSNNTITYTFNNAVSFKTITAFGVDGSLTVKQSVESSKSVIVYPNPTADRIYIKTADSIQAELFDILGSKLQSTKQNQLDLRAFQSGTYILKITNENNKSTSFKIIKL
jgi:hypothetical protein